MNTIGKATLLVGTREKFTHVEFHVVDNESQPVLGLQTCLDLQLIKRIYTVNTEDPNQLLNEYKDYLKDSNTYLEIIIFNSKTMQIQLFIHLGNTICSKVKGQKRS